MPPRFAYWTILIDDKATAFRARERDELLPTFNQLKRTNQNVVMKWFARGRLWESREESWAAVRQPERDRVEKRGKDWRPGGQHKDPRARFDKKKRPFARPPRDARRDARRPDDRRPDDRRPDDRRPDDRRSHDLKRKDARGKKPDQRPSRDRWRKDARGRTPGGKPLRRDKRPPRGDRPDRPPKPDRPPQHDDRPERREPDVPTPPTETPEPPPSPERIVGNRKSEV